MASINMVLLVGRLGQDPEVVTTNGGKSVAKLSVATSEKWKDKSGEWQEQTEWHKVVLWGPQSIWIGNNAHKGDMVMVRGKVTTRSWEASDGTKKYVTEVVAQSVDLLTPKKKPEEIAASLNDVPGFSADEQIPAF